MVEESARGRWCDAVVSTVRDGTVLCEVSATDVTGVGDRGTCWLVARLNLGTQAPVVVRVGGRAMSWESGLPFV